MSKEERICSTCGGAEKVLNPEWDRAWERYDNMGIFDFETCRKKADQEAVKYIPCPECSKKPV